MFEFGRRGARRFARRGRGVALAEAEFREEAVQVDERRVGCMGSERRYGLGGAVEGEVGLDVGARSEVISMEETDEDKEDG